MKKDSGQSKYSKLVEQIKEEILLGKIMPGEKIPSENTIAEKMSISRQTVRKAIALLVSEGFLYTEHGRGSFCADRKKSKGDSKNIGVITTYISEYIFPNVISGIDRILSDNGYSIVLKNTGNDTGKESVYLENMLDKNIDGLIIEPTKSALFSKNIKYYEALDKQGIPYVFIHSCYQQLENKPCILLDDAAGMYSAVAYLAKLGHKDIAGIFKADDIQGINRHKGYARALAQYNLPYDPDNVIWFHTEDRKTKPCTLIRSMIENKCGIDAIACYNDEIAVSIYETLRDMGINVPDDISLTGFDDSYLSSGCPVKITTVAHPKERLGEMAAQLLLDMLQDSEYLNEPEKRIIVPELVIKDSCRSRT